MPRGRKRSMNDETPRSPLGEMVRRLTRQSRPDCLETRVNVGAVPDRFLLPKRLAGRGEVVSGGGPVRWQAVDAERGIRVELQAFAMPFEFSVQDYLDAWATRLAWQRLDRAPAAGREAVEAWDLYRTSSGRVRQLRAFRNGDEVHVLEVEHARADADAEDVATLAAMSFQSEGHGAAATPAVEHRLHSGSWAYSASMVLRGVVGAEEQPEAIALLRGTDVPDQTMGRAWRLEHPRAWTGVVTERLEPSQGRTAEDWVEEAVGRTVFLCEALEGAVIQSSPPESGFTVAWAQSPGRRRGQAIWCAWFARLREGRVFRTCMVSPAIVTDPLIWASNLWLWQRLAAGVFVEPPEVVAERVRREAVERARAAEESQTTFLRRAGESQTTRLRKPAVPPSPVPAVDAGGEPGNTQRFRRPAPGESTTIPIKESTPTTQTQRFRRPRPPSEGG